MTDTNSILSICIHHKNYLLLSYLPNFIFITYKKMGACCCCELFEKHEILTNQSRLKLLQTKVQASYRTDNDPCFTYYLHYFQQHTYLERILTEHRDSLQLTDDSSFYQFDTDKIGEELQILRNYLQDYKLQQSTLYRRIQRDKKTIDVQTKLYQSLPNRQCCMIKLQIQQFQMIQGILKLKLRKIFKVDKQQKINQEYINVNRIKNQPIYRELVFPLIKGSKIQIVTQPIQSALTIDVQDIMKQQIVCDVLRVQARDEDFGFMALRMQFFTQDPQYNRQRQQKLQVLQRQLSTCLNKAKRGSIRGSLSSATEHNDHKQTFLSDYVSQYHNQYEI